MDIEELAGNKLTGDIFQIGMDIIEQLAHVITRDYDRPGFPSSWGHEVRCVYGVIEGLWKGKYSDLREKCKTSEDATRVIMPEDITRLYKSMLSNSTLRKHINEELSGEPYEGCTLVRRTLERRK